MDEENERSNNQEEKKVDLNSHESDSLLLMQSFLSVKNPLTKDKGKADLTELPRPINPSFSLMAIPK